MLFGASSAGFYHSHLLFVAWHLRWRYVVRTNILNLAAYAAYGRLPRGPPEGLEAHAVNRPKPYIIHPLRCRQLTLPQRGKNGSLKKGVERVPDNNRSTILFARLPP